MREAGSNRSPPSGNITAQLSAQPNPDANPAAEFSESMVYYGRQGNLLLIGPFLVAPNFQPDPGDETFVAMRIDGDLEPGTRFNSSIACCRATPRSCRG